MFKSRAIQVLVAALIMLGMHVCCCQVVPISVSGGCGLVDPSERSATHCCDLEHGDEGRDEQPPSEPSEPTHDCSGVHAKPLTSQTCKTEVPPLGLTAILPIQPLVLELEGSAPAVRSVQSPAPARETSLLRQHCALVV